MADTLSKIYPVFLLHCKWSIHNLDKFLSKYGTVGTLRIVYTNNRVETNRTIAILSDDVFQKLQNEGYDVRSPDRELTISRFELRESCFPTQDRNSTLFIPVPNSLILQDDFVHEEINAKLKHLAHWNIIPDDSWTLRVPLKSREKGEIKSGCFIKFNDDVHINDIAVARILMTDTYWGTEIEDEEPPVFKCFWARNKIQKSQPTTLTVTKILERPIEQPKLCDGL